MKIVISGPRNGRTSLCLRLADHCIRKGLVVGGMVSKESSDSDLEISDFQTGKSGLFARKNGEKIEDYLVDFECLEMGISAIENAIAECDVVLIDGIGPLEVHSKEFRQAYRSAFDSNRHVIATIDEKFMHVFSSGEWKRRVDNCIDISNSGVQKGYELVLLMYDRYLKTERV